MGFLPGVAERMVLNTFRKFPMKNIESADVCPPSNTKANGDTKTNASDKGPASRKPSPSSSLAATMLSSIKYTDDGKQIPVGNGGATANYWWTQSLDEVVVYVEVPMGTKAKSIVCEIKPTSLMIKIAGKESIINGNLPEKIKCEDSLWSLDSNQLVMITLEKCRKTWWKSAIQGDAEIDATKVDSRMRIDEYDQETQGAIRKIMFDQQQKAQGLPTSDEMKTNELLEKAKNLPGSPFLSSS